VKGRLHLTCGLDSAGRSALTSQYISAPMHISKPWWDRGLLIVNAINSTAGLFSGDDIETDIRVEPGAQLLLANPSANRAHRMPGGHATVRQSFHVKENAWLELQPSLFIPHAGSNYSQSTSIHLDSGARFLSIETFAPGRVASGESWQFTRIRTRFNLHYNFRPIARETYSISPDSPSVTALRHLFPHAYHATCYAVGADFADSLLAALTEIHSDNCWLGVTRLDAPAIALRLVASDNIHLSRALATIRANLHQAFTRPLPDLRRP
jgi:urease accessory protein